MPGFIQIRWTVIMPTQRELACMSLMMGVKTAFDTSLSHLCTTFRSKHAYWPFNAFVVKVYTMHVWISCISHCVNTLYQLYLTSTASCSAVMPRWVVVRSRSAFPYTNNTNKSSLLNLRLPVTR